MDRRSAVRALAWLAGNVLAAGSLVHAQSGRRYRIAILDYSTADPDRLAWWKAFKDRLAQLGYVENRNVVFETRFAAGNPERLATYAGELAKLVPDLIATAGTPAAVAAKKATSRVPIVTATGTDFSHIGLVKTLARPGENLTGVTSLTSELSAKRLQILRAFVPSAMRVAILFDETNVASRLAAEESVKNAGSLKITTTSHNVRQQSDVDALAQRLHEEHVQALVVVASPTTLTLRKPLAELALKRRLPSITGGREYAEAGALLSYGTDYPQLFRRAAEYVDMVLRGSRPGDLPIEQPSKFQMVVNMRTAREIGIQLPPSALAMADELIK